MCSKKELLSASSSSSSSPSLPDDSTRSASCSDLGVADSPNNAWLDDVLLGPSLCNATAEGEEPFDLVVRDSAPHASSTSPSSTSPTCLATEFSTPSVLASENDGDDTSPCWTAIEPLHVLEPPIFSPPSMPLKTVTSTTSTGDAAPPSSSSSSSATLCTRKKTTRRCAVCRKRVGLLGFTCRCDDDAVYCARHRVGLKRLLYGSDDSDPQRTGHLCAVDYGELQRHRLAQTMYRTRSDIQQAHGYHDVI